MSIPKTTEQWYFPETGSYQNLIRGDAEVPRVKANDVLVKVHAVSLQFRDLMMADRTYTSGNAVQNLVPCSDMAGEVIGIGEDVKEWHVGDRVCANFSLDHIHGDTNDAIQATSLGGRVPGVLIQYRAFPAHSLVKFPSHLTYEEASALPCATLTAYSALNGPVPVKAGDYVLVLGTGGVSIAGLQIAVASGATVIVTSSSDEKLGIAKKLGAKFVVNYKKDPEWQEQVLAFTNGAGVDHTLEVGGYGTLSKCIQASRVGGSIHIIGHVSQDSNRADVVFPIIMKAVTLRGIYIGSVAQFKALNRLIEANPEKTKPIVDKVFGWSETKEAYAYLESQKHVGKVVIKVVKD